MDQLVSNWGSQVGMLGLNRLLLDGLLGLVLQLVKPFMVGCL